MSNVIKASFQFNDFLIKESHFVLNNAAEYEFELAIKPSGVVFTRQNRFRLQLEFEAIDQNESANIKVVALSFFSYENIEDISNNPVFTENAPAIAYPYIRAYISTLTAQSGIKPIILPTLNLHNMADLLRKNIVVSEEQVSE
ncbi:hypothetical protein GCM10027299_28830 [Larkinella ripae]